MQLPRSSALLEEVGFQHLSGSVAEALRPDGQILQYTYSVFSPLQFRALGLEGERIGFVWKSCPPASLWRYRRRGSMG